MSTQIAVPESGAIAIPESDAAFMEVIARAAKDPTVDVGKMRELLEMSEKMKAKQAEMAFNQAMARLQPTLPRITKHGRIVVNGAERSTYAKIEDIDEKIRPLYSAEGFSVSWNTQQNGTSAKITGKLRHIAGHWEPYEITLPVDTSGSKNAVQGMGSTFQYGKRYLLCGMFNIITIDEDDDGQGEAAQPITEHQVDQIRDMIIHTGANEKKFCEYMDVTDIPEITKGRFAMAMNALKVKARKG